MKPDYAKYIAIAILSLAVGFLAARQCSEPEVIIKTITSQKIDTVFEERIIPGEKVYVKGTTITVFAEPEGEDAREPNIYELSKELLYALQGDSIDWPLALGDSLYLCPPFVSEYKSIKNNDTLAGFFDFPAMDMTLSWNPGPDTLQTPVITKIIEIEKPRAWYDSPIFGAGAVLAAEVIIYLLIK